MGEFHPHHERTRFEIAGHARFLTFSCFHRLPLFSSEALKDAFVEQLVRSRGKCRFRLIAWVIMPEHVHLLIIPSLPDCPVSRILQNVKGPFAQRVINRWRELRAPVLRRVTDCAGNSYFWQRGGGYDRNIYTESELLEKAKYIHWNPVTRKLVCTPDQWRWSSARWYEGDRDGRLQIDDW